MSKQTEIPGMEKPVIKEIEEAAEALRVVREKRMKLTTQEIAAAENLITICKAHRKELEADADGNLLYRYDDDMLVTLKTAKEKVSVRHAKEGDED